MTITNIAAAGTVHNPPDGDVVALSARVDEPPEPDGDLISTWARRRYNDLQRALIMGGDEESTGIVTYELPEL
jgi:hypothetical protein